jgi:hypothetical protein
MSNGYLAGSYGLTLYYLYMSHSSVVPEATLPEPDWDFDISAFLGQNIPVGEAGLDLGGYFDLAQSFFPAPPGSAAAHDNADVG